MKPKIEKGETLYRAIEFTRAAISDAATEKKTLRMSISSDEPYLRYDFWNNQEYYEILDHAPGGVDESRLKTGLPILFNHDRDKHLGRASAFLNDGHKITVEAKFSESDFAQEKLRDAMSGVLPDASIGYSLEDEGEQVGAKEGVPSYKFKWKPFEASLVTIPADTTVGVGRNRQTNFRSKNNMETTTMENEGRVGRLTKTQSEEHAEKIRELARAMKERSFAGSIPFDLEIEAEKFIAEEKTAKEFQKHCVANIRSSGFIDTMSRDHGNGRGSIAEQIVAHPEMKRALEGGQKTVSFVLPGFRSFREGLSRSTNVTTDVGPPTQYLPTVMGVAYEVLVVADLLAPGTMDTSQITFPKEVGPFVSGAATTAETAEKSEQAFSVVPATVAAKKVAAWTKISTELAQDSPASVSYINNRLGFAVQKAEDLQLLKGDGLGSNMQGIHNTPGIQVQAKGADIAPDAIRKAIANVEVNSDFICSGIVLHPTDFANIEMLKDSQGRYLVEQVLVRGELGQQVLAPSLWGKPIAVSKSETPGTALVGAFNTAAQLFRRIGLLIEMTNANENDFIRNLLAIRAELRAALAVYAGNAFCEVTGL